MALDRNGREAGQLGKGLLWLVVISGASVTAVNYIGQIGDDYSKWIIDEATAGKFGERVGTLAPAAVGAAALSPLFIIGIALCVMFAGITQVVLMLGRDAALVMLVGLLPVAVAAGLTGIGRQTRDKYFSWLIGACLYKPAAATVYAVGFKLVGDGSNARSMILGLVTCCIALA